MAASASWAEAALTEAGGDMEGACGAPHADPHAATGVWRPCAWEDEERSSRGAGEGGS